MAHLTTDCEIIHEKVYEKVKENMPSPSLSNKVSNFFKIMGDETRVKILWALDQHEMCVSDIAVLLNMTKSAVSHQLRILKDTHLVKSRRDGKIVFYALDDDHIKGIFEMTIHHISEECNHNHE